MEQARAHRRNVVLPAAGRRNSGFLAGGAEFGEDVFLDARGAVVDGVDEAGTVLAGAHHGLGDVELVEPADEFPLVAVEAPELILVPLRHRESSILNGRLESQG